MITERKGKFFVQVEGIRIGLYDKVVPTMVDWVTILPIPIQPDDLADEIKRFCNEQNILESELIHFQRIGLVV
jgi:hypothetical protein